MEVEVQLGKVTTLLGTLNQQIPLTNPIRIGPEHHVHQH